MIQEGMIASNIRDILVALKENPSREGLIKTPQRVEKSFLELTSGMGINPNDLAKDALFECHSKGMILQKNIEFYSLCEHHLLPFFGMVHIAYLPNQKIIGLSKIPKIVDILSRRLQVQEQLTHQICTSINEILSPHGVAVLVEARHFCMMMRGVKKQNSHTVTSEFVGAFNENNNFRMDFLTSVTANKQNLEL